MKKCMCIILSLLLTMSFLTVSAGSTDPKALIENLLSDHKNSSITAQENALLIAESYYNNIKDYENTQSPWSDVSASLLTSQLINKQSFRRTCELEYLRENEVTLSGSPSQALTDLLDSFVADNTAIDANYNFVDSAAAEEYSNLENDLTSVYSILLNLLDETSSAGIDVLVDGSPYTTATIDSTIDNMMADKIINLMKSIGSVMFSTKNTYQAALNGLFSDINIKLIGSMFGKDFAEAFADADTSQAIYDFMTGDDFLSQIISSNNFSDLFTKNAESANTAVSDIIAEVINAILDLEQMSGAKTGFLSSGLSAKDFTDAIKVIADVAEEDCGVYARIININILFGRYLKVYKNNDVTELPLLLDENHPSRTFDVKVSKDSYSASIINLIENVIYDDEAAQTKSTSLSASNELGELTFSFYSNPNDKYYMNIYRSGDLSDLVDFDTIYGYIGNIEIEVASEYRPVISVSIKQGSETTIYEDASERLEARIAPTQADITRVSWSSSDSKIVSVSSNGTIEGKKTGTAIITVTTDDGGHTASIKVIVKRRPSGGGGGGGVPKPPVVDDTKDDDIYKNKFIDVPETHWAAEEITSLVKRGIVKGRTADSFDPESPLTRAELAIIVTGMMNIAPVENGITYGDTLQHYAKNYISAAAKHGLMIGFDENSFIPDAYVTREQVISVILRAIHFKGEVLNDGSAVALNGDQILEKIITIIGYDPRGTITGYTDLDSSSTWAKGYIEVAIATGLTKGYEDNTIRPLVNSTRAEAVVMADRALSK